MKEELKSLIDTSQWETAYQLFQKQPEIVDDEMAILVSIDIFKPWIIQRSIGRY